MTQIILDYDKISNVQVEGIDTNDYPDFCDAFIASADYGDREMTEDELEVLNQDGCFINEAVFEKLQ